MGVTNSCQLSVFSAFAYSIIMIVKSAEDILNPEFKIFHEGEEVISYRDGEYSSTMINDKGEEYVPRVIQKKVESSIEKLNNGEYNAELRRYFKKMHNLSKETVSQLVE